jgi:phosphoserine phosphatase
VDGTLVPGTSSSLFLARLLGHDQAPAEAEDAYAAGTVDNHQVAELDAAGWSGATETQVRTWLDDLPLVPGIAETLTWCRRSRLVPVLATLAWSPVGDYLADRFGFHAGCGPVPQARAGRFTGRVGRHFDEYDKRDFALGLARDLGLAASACAAVGDSRSDLPLFASVGYSIAFNATPAARAAARARVHGADLRVIIPALSHWLRRDLVPEPGDRQPEPWAGRPK